MEVDALREATKVLAWKANEVASLLYALTRANIEGMRLDLVEEIATAHAEVVEAIRVASAAAADPEPRPPFPADGICPTCGADHNWQIQEAGYMRFTKAEMTPVEDWPPILVAWSNGWEDMSESGDDEWVVCQGEDCAGVYAVPESLERE